MAASIHTQGAIFNQPGDLKAIARSSWTSAYLTTGEDTLPSLCRDDRAKADVIFCARRLVFMLVHAQGDGGVLRGERERVLKMTLQVVL
jgi:hypothetical protein